MTDNVERRISIYFTNNDIDDVRSVLSDVLQVTMRRDPSEEPRTCIEEKDKTGNWVQKDY